MLFANSEVMGTFKGFSERGLEFAAEIVAPYNAAMLDRPQLGQFVLIELGSTDEAALGRITRFVPTGLLASSEGEDYVNTMQRRQQDVPENLKEQRLKYRVQLKLLGAVRKNGNSVIYIPSQRRLPHLGAKVALPSAQVLQELCRLSGGTTELGDYVLGEFLFAGKGADVPSEMFRTIDPQLVVSFDVKNLISRRSVIFARAGYGKSNLMKYLLSELYRTDPKTDSGRPVGTLIFDADGEYFWPDTVKTPPRPGLCDVPQLQDRLVVFTNRTPANPYYGTWKAGSVKLDIRDLPPRDVIGIAVSSDRQEQQNILKLKGLSPDRWRQLVDLIDEEGLQAAEERIGALLGYRPQEAREKTAEIGAAKSNMFSVVRTLHDRNSRVLSGTLDALSKGGVVIIDISLLSSHGGETLAGLVMRKIFSHNQENFTGGQPIIPTIAVIEEAQSVLGKRLEESSPFVEWVKEGRKYELGAMLITQQPGSVAPEILSQSDNWFVFHLLSEGDANVLGKYNAHFSDDILSHLIGEPIRGNCFMWSAPDQPFVLPVRIRSFEGYYRHLVAAPGTPAPTAALIEGVKKTTEGALDRLARAMLQQLCSHQAKYIPIPIEGTTYYGIKGGQLFMFIKEIVEAADTIPPDALKPQLLNAILGAGTYRHVKHDGADYFCATREVWEAGKVTSRHFQ